MNKKNRDYLKEYTHNKESHIFICSTEPEEEEKRVQKPVADLPDFKKRQLLKKQRKEVVQQYMEFYSEELRGAIRRNNAQIFQDLKFFLESNKRQLQATLSSQLDLKESQVFQVPTCLVVTTSESASSVDRQF